MNPIGWFDNTFALRLSLALAHFLWQGCVVALLVFAAAALLRRRSANLRYLVHLAALVLMVACVPVTFALTAVPETRSESDVIALDPLLVQQTRTPQGAGEAAESEVNTSLEDQSTAKRASGQPATLSLQRMAPLSSGLYVFGVTIMLVRLSWLLWGGRRLRRSAEAIQDNELLALVGRQARAVGLKAAPATAWCRRVSVPVVVGFVKPMILLPASLAAGLAPGQLEALLLHELAHIRRYDALVNLLQRIAEAALFFHPAVWYVSRRVSIEREHACDDFVLAVGCGRVAYADALVRMAELCAASAHLTGPATLLAASGSNPSLFHRRVLRLLDADSGPQLRLTRGGLVTALLLAAVAFTPVLLTSRAQAPSGSTSATPGEERVVQPEEDPNRHAAGEEAANQQTDVPQQQRHRRDRDQQSAQSQIPGFNLAHYPSTLEAVTIRDLYRPDPENPGRYRSARGVLTIPIYTARNYAILKYPVRLKRFYVQVRAPKGGRRTYGPIDGDPFEKLNLDEAIRAKLRTAERRPADALLRLRGMLSVGDHPLRARAFAMMHEIPQPAYRDRHTLDSLIATAADALDDISDPQLAAQGRSALERVEQLAADAKAEWQRRRVTLDETEYAAGESGEPEPSIVWGQPAENGTQLGIGPASERAVWQFASNYEVTLWVHNTGKEPVKFTSTSRADEGVRLWLVDEAGERHQCRIPAYTSWLVPQRYRLEPGQWVKLKTVGVGVTRVVQEDGRRPPVGRFSVEPGPYALEVELRIAAFESYDRDGNVDVPAAGEWTGTLTAKSADSINVGGRNRSAR